MFGSPEFRSLVWNVGYRCQFLHHAFVFNASHAIFVVGSPTEIVYALVVLFAEETMRFYGEAMIRLHDMHLTW